MNYRSKEIGSNISSSIISNFDKNINKSTFWGPLVIGNNFDSYILLTHYRRNKLKYEKTSFNLKIFNSTNKIFDKNYQSASPNSINLKINDLIKKNVMKNIKEKMKLSGTLLKLKVQTLYVTIFIYLNITVSADHSFELMTDYLLSTTSLEETWNKNDNIKNLFAGDWCHEYKDLRIEKLDYEILEYHWNDKKTFKDSIYIDKIYEKILYDLSDQLNKIHKKNYPTIYWRIMLNPWISNLITILFDRWEIINSAYNYYNISKTNILDINFENMVPFNSQHFKQGTLTSDIWNHFIFSEIIKFQNRKYFIIDNNKIYTIRKNFN